MKFYSPQENKATPKAGDTRTVKRFAWYKRIGDTIVVLEYYNDIQVYYHRLARGFSWRTKSLEVIPDKQN